ncbi:MAG TPA: molecular chaperone HtpG [Tepiditoga sp.]|nr:molecular chaperone HtpG [Tepiditoga sp.]
MEKKEFQTETKQLLNLMIHSIYTNKNIFLRELISNASDAIDKFRYEYLKNPEIAQGDENFEINISFEDNKLIIEDNGIGLSYEDAVNNLGTIASSGTRKFLENIKSAENNFNEELIGQFGVGFYSSFMVSDKVTVISKKYDEEKAVKWISDGSESYEIEYTEKEKRGTKIILQINSELSGEILNSDFIKDYIKKYSNYIKYPIKLSYEEENEKDEKELKTDIINSMQSLWRKDKKDIKEEEYNEFYKENFHDWQDPFETIHTKAEGTEVSFNALIFIPKKAPYDFFSKDYKRGLQLYTKNVFIMDKSEELIPEYFGFVKGLVDSPDFSLNISREILQESRKISVIKKNLEKKIIKTLEDLMKNDKDKYTEFWKEYGKIIKNGLYENIYEKDKLSSLLMFTTLKHEEFISLDQYISEMTGDEILFATGESRKRIINLPQMEKYLDSDKDVLLLTEPVDEFLITLLMNYKDKNFVSVSQQKTDNKEKTEDNSEEEKIIKIFRENLKDKVKDVRFSESLVKSPVCLVSENGISINMEKILSEFGENPVHAEKILEINKNHKIIKDIYSLISDESNDEKVSKMISMLYYQAQYLEGIEIDNPKEFINLINDLI